jgi:hypothetical protein
VAARSISTSLKDSLRGHFGLAGLNNHIEYKMHRAIINTLTALGLSRLLVGQPFSAEERPHLVNHFKLLHPAETLDFTTPGHPYTSDPFLRSCQDITEGRLSRAAIFTCEVANAKLSPRNGLVFDARWHNIVESILDYQRLYSFRKTFRPRRITRRSGVFSSVQHPWHYNNWHWTVDSLPQIRSLEIHMEGRPLTLLMSSEVGRVHRESLAAILPQNFTVEYVDPEEWFELETFVLPSFVSSRANAFFPPEYYEFIRSRTFLKLNIPRPAKPRGRYYISRDRAKHRRVLNETETTALLAEFGFEKVFMEDFTFAQQAALFRNSEAIISPHGAALGGIVYGENLKVCVLYPEARPAGYFYTLALGAGHQHFCTNANVAEDDDFLVDIPTLRRVLTEEMCLCGPECRPSPAARRGLEVASG